ncbi:DUF3768 domain-containing protein [Yoonia sp. GPGPB17]|uniref:DUF3768 domain-containing protein n=1 Tax=Yoonia sp. GPGPB17 TaxID=3026147 RepID=UPI0030C4367A
MAKSCAFSLSMGISEHFGCGLRERNTNDHPLKQTIRDQNDKFRALDPSIPGRVFFTQGVQALVSDNDDANAEDLLAAIRAFDDFNTDNDPHGEHDFGSLTFCGTRIFWKIDLYDQDFAFGSEEPANLEKTQRLLTIMLPEEY